MHKSICSKYANCNYNKYSKSYVLVSIFVLSAVFCFLFIYINSKYVECYIPQGGLINNL